LKYRFKLIVTYEECAMPEPQYLYLTTTGWKTGKPHEIEIWYVEHEGRYYLCSEKRDRSHWVRNIQRLPAVSFRVGEQRWQGNGRIVLETESDLLASIKAKMDAKYGWSDGLFVELTPELKFVL
jgi:deazaflavin-dependent oxidoreductase (nitroreductase family)